jgi:hypothetical protein
LLEDIGFKLTIGTNAVHVDGPFPDGSVCKGITQFK